MNGPGEYYAKRNKPVRKRQIPYYFTYMWNLVNKINKQDRNRLIDTENRLKVVRGERVWGAWVKPMKQKTPKNKTKSHGQQYGDYQKKRRMEAGGKG